MSGVPSDPLDLARRLLARERDAVAPALDLVDDGRPARRADALRLLDALCAEGGASGGERIGITGAPGAGKSTLLDALVRALRRRGETLGILAVDPSSQHSGGALLGDRIRVRASAGDPGVFLRSMAARSRLGGLADASWASVAVLAAVFDRVFVETVGVGQSETDVASLVDTLVFVANPGTGDSLQYMKAGVIEHPDLFVVNKADQGAAAERAAAELRSGLGLGVEGSPGDGPAVLLTSARDGTGIDELVAALDARRAALRESGSLAERRLRGRQSFVLEALLRRYGSYGVDALGGREALRRRVGGSKGSAFSQLAALGREIEDALRQKPGA